MCRLLYKSCRASVAVSAADVIMKLPEVTWELYFATTAQHSHATISCLKLSSELLSTPLPHSDVCTFSVIEKVNMG